MAIGTSLLFEDDFDRADDPTGLGPDWTEDTLGSNTVAWEIISNEATGEITAGTSGEYNWAYVNTFSADNADYKIVCDQTNAVANRVGWWLRRTGSGATVSGYQVYRNGLNTLVIDRVNAGVVTNLLNQFEDEALSPETWTIEIEDISGDPRITVGVSAAPAFATVTDSSGSKITDIGDIGFVFRTSSSAGIVYAWDNLQVFGTGGDPVADIDFYTSDNISDTGTTATIVTRSSTASTVKIEYSTASDFTGSSTTANQVPAIGDDYRLKFSLTGLAPDTKYYFRGVQDDTVNALNTGELKTGKAKGQAHTFTYGFASCAQNNSVADTFARAAAHDPLFFIQGGDLHYEDIITNDITLFEAAYLNVFSNTAQAMLYAKVGLMYMWDDHDYGANNSGASSPSKVAAQDAYREYIAQTLELGSGAVYYSKINGRVKFIIPDLRSERAGIELMSATQQAWFEAELTDSEADPDIQVTVVWMSCPWIATGEGDTWSDASVQRTEIADHIYSLGIENNIVFLGGDMHAIAYDDGTNNTFDTLAQTGWPVYQSAAMDQTGSIKGGPYSFAASTGGGRYTMMEIADTGGTSITLTTTGYAAADAVLYTDVYVMTTEAIASGGEIGSTPKTKYRRFPWQSWNPL